MQVLRIQGGRTFSGQLPVQGAKNSALPLLAASILCRGELTLLGCPRLSDVDVTVEILRALGCTCIRQGEAWVIGSGGVCEHCIY